MEGFVRATGRLSVIALLLVWAAPNRGSFGFARQRRSGAPRLHLAWMRSRVKYGVPPATTLTDTPISIITSPALPL